jgi:hypothetical protein
MSNHQQESTANKMSFTSPADKDTWSIRPTVQCDNSSCRSWNDTITPGTKCFKCLTILPTWVGYLNNDGGGDILEESNYPPPPPIERTTCQEQETWYDDERIQMPLKHDSLKLIRRDGNTEQEEKEHVTNAEQVIRDMMLIYNLDREGVNNKFDEIIKNAIVKHF